jgi:hypothetical protein
MRLTIFRTVFALGVAGSLAASLPATAGRLSAGLVPTLPIYVDMECQSSGGGSFTCQASAGGGTGVGYSYTWSNSNGSTWEYYDQDGSSEAEVACYGGLGQGTTALITATVTDSNGATGSKSRIINCGY